MKTLTQKTATLFLVCLISLAITGYTYSHWTDIATVLTTVKMGHLEITINDEKFICNYTFYPGKTGDNKTLTISAEITQGWQIWVGIIIKNNGTVPATITHELTATNDIQYVGRFRNETHFYGPYTTIPPEVWCELNEGNPPPPSSPPPPGEQTPPIDLPVGQKLVVWQKIRLEDQPPNDFAIDIHSKYTATLGPWQDWVQVIYSLIVRR